MSYEQPQEINQTQTVTNNTLEGVLLEPASTCSIDTSAPASEPSTPDLVSSIPSVSTNAGHVPTGQIKPTKTLTKEQHLSAPMESPNVRNGTVTENNVTVVKPVPVHSTVTMEFNDSKGI